MPFISRKKLQSYTNEIEHLRGQLRDRVRQIDMYDRDKDEMRSNLLRVHKAEVDELKQAHIFEIAELKQNHELENRNHVYDLANSDRDYLVKNRNLEKKNAILEAEKEALQSQVADLKVLLEKILTKVPGFSLEEVEINEPAPEDKKKK